MRRALQVVTEYGVCWWRVAINFISLLIFFVSAGLSLELAGRCCAKLVPSHAFARRLSAALEPPECEDYPDLRFEGLLRNNLGGLGPGEGAEGLVYRALSTHGGEPPVEIHVNAISPYQPFSPRMNGFSGRYGKINVRPGTHARLNISIRDPITGHPRNLKRLALTFLDLDKDGERTSHGLEYVRVGGFVDAKLADDSEVSRQALTDGRTEFAARAGGPPIGIPVDPHSLSQQQRRRAVSLLFSEVSSFTVEIGALVGRTPGLLAFTFRPSVPCAAPLKLPPLLPAVAALGTTPGEQPSAGRLHPVIAPLGSALVAWLKRNGEIVKRGDPVARVEDAQGHRTWARAPVDGTVRSEQRALELGKSFDAQMTDLTIAVIEARAPLSPLPVGRAQTSVRSVGEGAIFEAWLRKEGDIVAAGEALATVKTATGHFANITAEINTSLVLVSRQLLEKGDDIDRRVPDHILAVLGVVEAPQLKALLSKAIGSWRTPVKITVSNGTFLSWSVQTGDVVSLGDQVAVLQDCNGSRVAVRASATGTVVSKQALQPGDAIVKRMLNQTLLVIEAERLPYPEIGPGQVGVDADLGQVFVSWSAAIGDALEPGDPVAVVRKDSGRIESVVARRLSVPGNSSVQHEHPVVAPRRGRLIFRQPFQPGDPVDYRVVRGVMRDRVTIAVLDTRSDVLEAHLSRGEVPVEVANARSVFVSWQVGVGYVVKKGDPVCLVQMAGTKSVLHAADAIVVSAPADGMVSAVQPLVSGDILERTIVGRTVAIISKLDVVGSRMPWRLYVFEGLVIAAMVVGWLLFCLRDDTQKISYSLVPTEENTSRSQPPFEANGHRQVPSLSTRLAASGLPSPVCLEFLDGEGRTRTFYFNHRPLGMVLEKEQPNLVVGFHFNSYARNQGVEAGWTLLRIEGQDVADKNIQQLKAILDSHLNRHKLWPLRLDFRSPSGEGERTFMMDRRPIGIEFSRKTPVVVSRVHAGSYAERKGIRQGWFIVGIAGQSVDGLRFSEVMQNYCSGVDLLDESPGFFVTATADPIAVPATLLSPVPPSLLTAATPLAAMDRRGVAPSTTSTVDLLASTLPPGPPSRNEQRAAQVTQPDAGHTDVARLQQ